MFSGILQALLHRFQGQQPQQMTPSSGFMPQGQSSGLIGQFAAGANPQGGLGPIMGSLMKGQQQLQPTPGTDQSSAPPEDYSQHLMGKTASAAGAAMGGPSQSTPQSSNPYASTGKAMGGMFKGLF